MWEAESLRHASPSPLTLAEIFSKCRIFNWAYLSHRSPQSIHNIHDIAQLRNIASKSTEILDSRGVVCLYIYHIINKKILLQNQWMRSICWLVKWNILSLPEPITEGVREHSLMLGGWGKEGLLPFYYTSAELETL